MEQHATVIGSFSQNSWNNTVVFFSKHVFLLRRLSFAVSPKTLRNAYFGLFESRLNYEIPLWGGCSRAVSVIRLQKAAIGILGGAAAGAHCRPLFRELGLLTLPALYVLATLVRVRNSLHAFPKLGDTHEYGTRNRSMLSVQRHRLTLVRRLSPDFMGVKLFNCLPGHLRSLPPKTFATRIKEILLCSAPYTVEEMSMEVWFLDLEGVVRC